MIRQIILIALLQIPLLSCETKENETTGVKGIKLFQKNIEYPYIASEKRKTVILNNMNKLKKGMTKEDVINLMTQPDEANMTYKFKKAKSDDVIGFSLVYILRRDTNSERTLEKNEHLLRIHFNNSGKLLWAYATNINKFKGIDKAQNTTQ